MTKNTNLSLSDWVNDYTLELYSWANHKVSNAEMAKDLVQDTFLAAAEKIDSFKGESSPKTWLFSILNYKIIDYYRKKVKQTRHFDTHTIITFFNNDGDWRRHKKPIEWPDDVEHLLDNAEFNKILQKCIEALPKKWNLSVKLKYLLNKNSEDICQELELTPSNYWQILHRAKLNLRECIERNWIK